MLHTCLIVVQNLDNIWFYYQFYVSLRSVKWNMAKKVRYPIGDQSFENIRSNGFLYVDKTEFIEKIVEGSQYYFLGRPRRFGKSLFLSTLKNFFEGKRELFKGLYADSMEWTWEPYPVLYLDLNNGDYRSAEGLRMKLDTQISEWEALYGKSTEGLNVTERFRLVIERASRQTGKPVVILVDEYDKPLVNSLHNPHLHEEFRSTLSNFYSNFKSSADFLRLVFMTGVSRFGKVSIFSGLNNIKDISFNDDFASICGITDEELRDNFSEGLNSFASKFNTDSEGVILRLKNHYDGYHFSRSLVDIFNPFSILNALDDKSFNNYWVQSGHPTLLANLLLRKDTDLSAVINSSCTLDELVAITSDAENIEALLYQTGYVTIKEYDPFLDLFTLGLPNREVCDGFFNFLMPWYVELGANKTAFVTGQFVMDAVNGLADSFMKRLQSLLASITYRLHVDYENNLQNVLYMLMTLVGLRVEAEYETSDGRIDLLITTDRFRYVIELKIDSSAEKALRQIDEKKYVLPFIMENRAVFKIGANFSTKTRTLTGWVVEQVYKN